MIFIDEVNQANGSVEIWTNSQWIPLDEKICQRATTKSGLQAQLLQGPPGTVVVFDSRIWHRSLRNTTQNRRLTLVWNVSSKDGIETIETDEHPTLALCIGTPDHLINIFHVRHTYSQFCVVRFNGICNT
jgi:ectoine hydroxylase-related dioxygenase (phytanoyl-CoA dioxygenase family)